MRIAAVKRAALRYCGDVSGKTQVLGIASIFHLFSGSNRTVAIVAPSLRQATYVMRRAKQIYRAAPLIKSASESALMLKLVNNSSLVAVPSTQQTVRGLSCSMILADEAARCSDELILSVLPFVAARENAKVCLASSPAGARGIFYRLWKEENSGYKKIQITADEIPRISMAYLNRMELEMGERWLRQEFYCSFESNEASIFSNQLINRAVRSFSTLDDVLSDILEDDSDEGEYDGDFQFNDLGIDLGED